METGEVKFELARIIAVVTVLSFIGVLLYYLPLPGYSESRFIFFGILAGVALLGAAGVIVRNIAAIVASSLGLFALGYWQVVFGIYILPTAGILLVAAYSEAMRQKQ